MAVIRPKDKATQPLIVWTPAGWKLFLLGFLTLFLELFFIRFLAASIWNLGYFPNLVLLSVFIGMGIGFVFHHHFNARASAILFQVSFIAAAGLVVFLSWKHPVVPGFGEWQYNIDGDLYFSCLSFEVENFNYLFFVLCFVMVVFIFACLSQRTAKLFRQFAPLTAYTLDISGSCAGILTFMAVSALQMPAYSWFAIFTLLFVFAMADAWKWRWIPVVLSTVAIVMMYQQDQKLMSDPKANEPVQTCWSPYQKIEYVEQTMPSDPPRILRRILANGLDHQQIHDDLKGTFYETPYVYRAEKGLPPCQNVLIIGAGSGNDVTAALQRGAAHIDAVEIDPVIARLGREHNISKAYFDPRVNLEIDDGRAFMTRTQKRYDLIIFALTDSLVKVSSLTQLRLENYLFTRESVARACELLAEDGSVVFYNYYRLPFVADRIQRLVEEATGAPPKILYQNEDFYMVCGDKPKSAVEKVDINQTLLPTDDWPFLYLESRGIPAFYLKAMAGVCLLVIALLVALHFTSRHLEEHQKPGLFLEKIAFVLMGVAFLLLETKSIIQFSLLFGTTWLNNSLIFLAVLISVLVANWTAQCLKGTKFLWVAYVFLIVSALSWLVFPLHELLHIQNGFVRFIVASIVTFAPIYFANLMFGLIFKEQKIAEHLFGWNLLGATFGGILEYSSMALGYNALGFIIVACYTAVFALLLAARRRMSLPATRR